jgi:hypothetical protein
MDDDPPRHLGSIADMSERMFRAFTIRGGMLASPVLVSHRWPGPGPDFVATCEKGHQPPDPACSCGLYVWKQLSPRACLHSRAPRVFAAVDVPGEASPVSGTCPIYPYRHSARVARFRLLQLWLVPETHCMWCRASAADPNEHKAGEDAAQLLEARYGVTVSRL